MRKRYALAAVCEAAGAALALWSVSRFFTAVGDGNMQVSSWTCMRYFTVLSNLLSALASVAVLPQCLRAALSGKARPRPWVLTLKLAGSAAVAVTLTVVLVFLGPVMGFRAMLAGNNLYLHLLCPLLAIVSFCLLEPGERVSRRQAMWGALPSLLYGTVYLIMVVVIGEAAGGWPDFYMFNRDGLWYVSYPAIIIGSYALSSALCALRNRTAAAS